MVIWPLSFLNVCGFEKRKESICQSVPEHTEDKRAKAKPTKKVVCSAVIKQAGPTWLKTTTP